MLTFFSSYVRVCAADREHAAGVPQHGDPWLRSPRRRQARVHGALLQRQGQVGLAWPPCHSLTMGHVWKSGYHSC
jgi:hypothetical protein